MSSTEDGHTQIRTLKPPCPLFDLTTRAVKQLPKSVFSGLLSTCFGPNRIISSTHHIQTSNTSLSFSSAYLHYSLTSLPITLRMMSKLSAIVAAVASAFVVSSGIASPVQSGTGDVLQFANDNCGGSPVSIVNDGVQNGVCIPGQGFGNAIVPGQADPLPVGSGMAICGATRDLDQFYIFNTNDCSGISVHDNVSRCRGYLLCAQPLIQCQVALRSASSPGCLRAALHFAKGQVRGEDPILSGENGPDEVDWDRLPQPGQAWKEGSRRRGKWFDFFRPDLKTDQFAD